jgi:hypothetical protein
MLKVFAQKLLRPNEQSLITGGNIQMGTYFKFPCSQCLKRKSEQGLQTHMEIIHQGKQLLTLVLHSLAAMIESCMIKGYMERRNIPCN